MRSIANPKVFWIVFSVAAIMAVVISVHFFPEAIPIMQIDLKMTREMALESAGQLAEARGFSLEQYRQAAEFDRDYRTQFYIELEAGGAEAFRQLCASGLYSPYTWNVRHFKEGETKEITFSFTPAGVPYRFSEKVPETAPGADLSAAAARLIAENSVEAIRGVRLQDYELVEVADELRPSGRRDHTFVYQRPDQTIGQGVYRLRLVVVGDRLTEATPFIKTPEGFARRYQEMRSSNALIQNISGIAYWLLYMVGGAGIGLFWLNRQRLALWKAPLIAGIGLAFLKLLANLNDLPLDWMWYDTALPANLFLFSRGLSLMFNFASWAVIYTFSFMAAESLTRQAFPDHIQFWRLWSSDVASTRPALGLTVGGYLGAAVTMGYLIIFCLIASWLFGRWSPIRPLIDPNIMATPFPWLPAMVSSLSAGFWEECVFRAIPIAGAVLISRKTGFRTAWIVAALIVQAVIFGGVHAGYATQPAYARVLELIPVSLVYGVVYLYYGLLPVIIVHFLYNVFWFASPIFVSTAPRAWIDQGIVIFTALIPLGVVLYHRLKAGAWKRLNLSCLNRAWQAVSGLKNPFFIREQSLTPTASVWSKGLIIAGIIGLLLWISFADFVSDHPRLRTDRQEAEQLAIAALAQNGVQLDETWRVQTEIIGPSGTAARFVWNHAGKDAYHELMGNYLSPPHWQVRFVRFEGVSVAERAEEFRVDIDGEGGVMNWSQRLPEARPGASIAEQAARERSLSEIQRRLNIAPAQLTEVSIAPSKLAARTDWEIIWRDASRKLPLGGEARISVRISGDQVTNLNRFIHIPEDWLRNQNRVDEYKWIFQRIYHFARRAAGFLCVAGILLGWSFGAFSRSKFIMFTGVCLGIGALNVLNSWPQILADFSTSRPFNHQLLLQVGDNVIQAGGFAIAAGLLAGAIQALKPFSAGASGLNAMIIGLSLGVAYSGLKQLIWTALECSPKPVYGAYYHLNSLLPAFSIAADQLMFYIMATLAVLIGVCLIHQFTHDWTRRKPLFIMLMLISGFFLAQPMIEEYLAWITSALLAGIFVVLCFRYFLHHCLELAPFTVAGFVILETSRQAVLNSHPAAVPGAMLAIALILAAAFGWRRLLLTGNDPHWRTIW